MKLKLRIIKLVLLSVFLFVISSGKVQGQIFEIKKWNGTYPDMEESYPLTFVAFNGKIIPIPHVFILTWPTHYYLQVVAMPVTDSPELVGKTKTGLVRIAAKLLERFQMEGRHSETEQIKVNTELQEEIEKKLFDSRSDQLEDIYKLAERFILLYKKVDRLGHLENSAEVKNIFTADGYGQAFRA